MSSFLVLVRKELSQGSKNFFFVFAVFIPLLMGLFLSLAFGTWFSGNPKLGIYTPDTSALVEELEAAEGVRLRLFESEDDLTGGVAGGTVSLGMILPPGFDDTLAAGKNQTVTLLVWGESSPKDRVRVALALMGSLRDLSGETTPPVEVVRSTVGDEQALGWDERLLPLVVLMAVAMSGLMIAGSSVLSEREKKTIRALSITNAQLFEVYLAKGIFAIAMALVSAVIVLGVNRAFGDRPGILMLFLFLGAILTTCVGLGMGSVVKDETSFTAAMKGLGFFLYIPGMIMMFPDWPQWPGMVFPTYYVIHPISEMVIKGEPFSAVAWELCVLVVIDLVAVALVIALAKRQTRLAD